MILISHRGNLNGKSDRENQPDYIGEALDQGFDVEIDVWYHQHEFYLGHDEPQYKIDEKFLEKEGLWCHAKNIDALNQMIENERIHCFFHQEVVLHKLQQLYMTFPKVYLFRRLLPKLP